MPVHKYLEDVSLRCEGVEVDSTCS